MLWRWLFIVPNLLVVAIAMSIDPSAWENVHYYRNVDLSMPYVKESNLITAKNTGDKPSDLYFFTVNDGFDAIHDISYAGVTMVELNLELQPFEVRDGIYAVKFPYPVAPGSTVEFKFRYAYANVLSPLPQSIALDDKQKLLIEMNKLVFSAYKTQEYSLALTGLTKGQEMKLQLNKEVNATMDFPELKGQVDKENNALTYGPIVHEIPSFSVIPMGMWYDHNRPLLRVVKLDRLFWLPASDIDVVQTEEYYELTNDGALLKNGFSRAEWLKLRQAKSEHFGLSQFTFGEDPKIPFNNHYVTDKVGVVSTHMKTQGHLLVQPRFPLFGGWNYNFTLGWNNRLENLVHKDSSDDNLWIASFTLLNDLKETYYQDVALNFYLPEGAELVDVAAPMLPYEKIVLHELSYLDVADGHVKVTLKFKNLHSEILLVKVILKYRYTSASYWTKVNKIASFVFAGLASYYALGVIQRSV